MAVGVPDPALLGPKGIVPEFAATILVSTATTRRELDTMNTDRIARAPRSMAVITV